MAEATRMPVKVPIDAEFEEIVRAFERLWQTANPPKIGDIFYAVEDTRPA
jgi:hypothetical protein